MSDHKPDHDELEPEYKMTVHIHHHHYHGCMPGSPGMSMMAAGEFGFAEVAPTCSGQLYTVAAGDTLSAIARRNNVTVTAILAANPQITNPNVLTVGQLICIPGAVTPPGPGPCTGTQYTIAAGDTLFALASRYGVTVDAILAANPGLDPNSLQVGRIICIPTTAPPPTTCPGFTYTIKAGDTLYALARQYGTTIAELRRYNPGVDPASLVVGQRICIPVPAPPGPGPCQGVQYTIVAGDTLFALATRYGTTVAEIQRANPGITPESLRVGQIICIPVPAPPGPGPCQGVQYTIVAGDTLFALAQRYSTTVAEIQRANPGITPESLRVGQIICIPTRR